MFVNAESIERMPNAAGAVMHSARRSLRGGVSATPKMRDGSNMAMVELSPRERITAVVRRLLGERSITRTFTTQEELRDVGLTSLDMVNLVLAVESELGVAIPEGEITPANFRSVATIEALVAGLQHRSAA
jgi:acyl carrier protein